MNETVFIELMRLICAKYDDLNEFVPWHIMHWLDSELIPRLLENFEN